VSSADQVRPEVADVGANAFPSGAVNRGHTAGGAHVRRVTAMALALRSMVRPGALCGLAWVLVFCAVGVWNGPDASWDLLNYHLYGPFALFHRRYGFDITPAQGQTFFAPTLDIPAYWLRSWLNDEPNLLDALLSLPQGIGAYLATLIALRFVPATVRWRWPVAMLLAAIGATGVASFSTLATPQSDMIPGCFVLGGFLLLLRLLEGHPSGRGVAMAGLLFGTAAGLKLTSAPYSLGAATALLLARPGPFRVKIGTTMLFGLSVLGGTVLLGGWWWLHLYATYGNPLFPFYNTLFHSPYAPLDVGTGYEGYKPAGPLRALFYPFYWAFGWEHPTAEVVMRDPRFAMTCLAFWVATVRHVLRAPDAAGRQVRLLLVFFGVSYAVWEAQFSLFRFLAPVEMLCGIVIFLPLRALLGSRRGLAIAGLTAVAATAVLLKLTFYPDWGHAKRGGSAISVHMPPLPANSLAVFLDPSPMGYLVAYMPPSVRVVGANNPVLHPGQTGLLEDHLEQVIATWPGPIYGFENPVHRPGMADRTLGYYGLHRGPGCTYLQSNLENYGRTLVCPLERDR
jgi:hypothetical protein